MAAGRDRFCLEGTAKNVMDFAAPDNNGNQFRNKVINSNLDINSCLKAGLNFEQVLANL